MPRLSIRFAGRWLLPIVLVVIAFAQGGSARVLDVAIERRVPLLDGRSFGSAGAYELIEGQVHFGFDPANRANTRVADLSLAARGDDGLVHASADLLVLQPVDPTRRRGTALVGVPNRGRPLALGMLNRGGIGFGPSAELDPTRESDWGDGFLMEQGLTVIWVGWQADVLAFPGAMGIRVPVAKKRDGSALRGLVRSDWVVEEAASALTLAAPGHRPQPVANAGSRRNRLTRRETREGEPRPVPREQWAFSSDGTQIVMDAGFEPAIYELVYVSEAPPLVGLGFAAFRDIAAYAEHDPAAEFPVKRSVAIGSSQSGRFLRHFLYEGFNRDEAGRRVYDGVIVDIAGAGRGGFNHRFSHPGRVGSPFQNFFYPGDDFPFASRPVELEGRSEGLLDRAVASKTAPKLFQVNTGYEYWGRAASLIHMTPDGAQDVEPLEHERLYHIASAPHYSLPFPPAQDTEVEPGLYRGSAVDRSYVARALLLHMLGWVEGDVAPPRSNVPRIDEGTLVEVDTLAYPISFLKIPRAAHVAYRLDFGPSFVQGIVEHQPPRRGPAFALRVPAIDELGNERTGIRLLELTAPIGTYTPWALRTGHAVGSDEMAGFFGSFLPLATSPEERERRGDGRKSLVELYPDEAAYAARVEAGIETLVRERWLLERDRAHAREAAMQRWRWIAP